MKKYAVYFISVSALCIIVSCIVLHFFTQKNGIPPLSWEEVWKYKFVILGFSLVGGLVVSLGIYVESKSSD